MTWRLRRVGESDVFMIEKLGNDSKWHATDRIVTAANEAEARRIAESWMGKTESVSSNASEKTSNVSQQSNDGQKPPVHLYKSRASTQVKEEKNTARKHGGKTHSAERKSKTGVASYQKGTSCGRGKHSFKTFGHYAVCLHCGSRKTLTVRKSSLRSHGGRRSRRSTRGKVESR